MPTFTAIALDSLLEPGASRSVEKSVPRGKLPNSKPPISKLRNANLAKESTVARPQMSPALYATPEAIPLPDSPSSFPPSPYIINHKARGPRLLKSFPEDDASPRQKALNGESKVMDAEIEVANLRKSTSVTFSTHESIEEHNANGVNESSTRKKDLNGRHDSSVLVGRLNGEFGSGKAELDASNKVVGSNGVSYGLQKEKDISNLAAANVDGGSEDFYDPGESASYASNSELEDDAGTESQKQATSMGEFYDAWEELSSDSGIQTSVARNIEAELREIRLCLLMEIEMRRQAEEALNHLQTNWQRIRKQLALVGVTLPADPLILADCEEPNINLEEELRLRFEVARFVSDSMGRGIAKAEVEMEMEARLEAKNFEIARLTDKLHYYEAVNREMSQRNQEAIELARQDRQRRKRRQKWIWGSIAVTIALGSAALAWSYLPSRQSSSSSTDVSPKTDE